MQPIRAAVASSLLGVLVCLTLGLAPASALAASGDICPRDGKLKKVYLLGSSTMGSVLGPMLQTRLKKDLGVKSKRWGKASSGLARPDYHDWLRLTPGLMNKHKPQVVVISLGTNDNQPIFKKKGSWVKTDNPRWRDEYAARVRKMLDKAAGKDRKRSVIWMGPTRFPAKNSRTLGPVVSDAIRQEIEAFDGRAIYIDSFSATTNQRGKSLTKFKKPGKRELQPARTSDGIHLTTDAVRWLLAEPVLQLLAPCVKPAVVEADKEPAPAARAEPAREPKPKPDTKPSPEPTPTPEPAKAKGDDAGAESKAADAAPAPGR